MFEFRRGMGRGFGGGRGFGEGNKPGSGPCGVCICPTCGYSIQHQRGTPCYRLMCPECQVALIKQ